MNTFVKMNLASTVKLTQRLKPSKNFRAARQLQVRAGVTNSNDLRNGLTLEIDNQPFRVVEFLHVKPGKGAAFVRTKLKNCITGAVMDKTFRGGEQLETAEVVKTTCQYTYIDGSDYVFMDMESFEERRVPKDDSWARYMKEGVEATLMIYEDRVINVEPPATVEMLVTQAEEGVKGNTVQGGTHPVTIETGAVITAPLFVGEGDKIKIDTRRNVYLSRV